jgi:hypothetical protein
MEFQTGAQRECYEKIAPWMKEIFGDFMVARNDIPILSVLVGSAYASVGVSAWGEDDAVITARSYVVTGVEMNEELMLFLLQENDRMRFGAYGLDKDKDIFFEHAIVGSTCDKEELKASVMAVILTADNEDDKLIARWGGQRAVDRTSS